MRTFLLCSLLMSCTTPSKNTRDAEFDVRLQQVESLGASHSFFIDMDRCFIDYLMCKNNAKLDKKCWSIHEKCVINTYRTYKQLELK